MQTDLRINPLTGERYLAVLTKGRQIMSDPLLNKGTAFTQREREELALHGLLPPATSTMKKQLRRTYERFSAQPTDLDKFIYLNGLRDRNELLFYRLVHDHIEEMMPIVYTPVVGEACQKFSHIFRTGRGLYISYEQRGEIDKILRNSGIENPSIIVVTDGERILGLGDQGAGGMGIPIGKLALYTLCAGVSPYTTLPIMLDAGTDNEERLQDPLYLGMKHRRVRGDEYQAFIDAFVAAVKRVFPDVVLQWEDFLKGNAIKQLDRFRDKLCSFNDDIQGTAGVVVSGLLGSARITGKSMNEQRVLFAGAGAAAQGISDLIVAAMVEDGLSREEAVARIYTVDSRGLVTTERSNLEDFKAHYARDVAEVADWEVADRSRITLAETVANAKPTILLGTSGAPGMFSEEVVRTMARINERPVIFPLSNPTSKSECTATEAITWSEGRAIVATGSPFDPVRYGDREHRIGQGNNAYIFPGVGLGLTVSRTKRVTDMMFLAAAHALAGEVSEEDLAAGSVYPPLSRIRECSHAVACATVQQSVKEGYADAEILDDLERRVRQAMWQPEYLPIRYEFGRVVYRDVPEPPSPLRIKGATNRVDCTTDGTIELVDLLRGKTDDLLADAVTELHRAHLEHYEAQGLDAVRQRLSDLLERTLTCLETGRAEPIVEWATKVGRERFVEGFDLFEVQTSINVLEEVIWRRVLAAVGPNDLAHALGLANAILGMAKDKLAREYVALARDVATRS
ncbi:MAG: NAD-dependent malic enzyme [bacterium]|nr:NAD-dependent malic enzyme [bacterium]